MGLGNNSKGRNLVEWQLALIRIYIGIDFIHHFAEKFGLLGHVAYNDVHNYFYGIGMTSTMVTIAGLCEFGAFIGFTFGIFTRYAAVGTALYLLIALFSGHHQDIGFTWANHGTVMFGGSEHQVNGGWEYPLLWAFLCLSYVLTGGRKLSLDCIIRRKFKCKILKFLSF